MVSADEPIVDELIEQAKNFSSQRRRDDAASCLFSAADLVLKQNQKLPQKFRRISLCYELNVLANIELLKDSKFDIDIIDKIIENLNKIIELGEDTRVKIIWAPHIKYFKALKYCSMDSLTARENLKALCQDSKISEYFAESLVYILCKINSINYNDKDKIEKIDKIIQDISAINPNTPSGVKDFLRDLSHCLKKLKNESDDLTDKTSITQFYKVFKDGQEDVYTLIGDQIYTELIPKLEHLNLKQKIEKFYKEYEIYIKIILMIIAVVGFIRGFIIYNKTS